MDGPPLKQCPCCYYRTGCSTCPVCFWTDDGRGESDTEPAPDGPNGDLTLSVARLNFALYGASHQRYVDVVRPARPEEHP